MSPGPGSGGFGSGPFGRFDWSRYHLVDLIPEIYRQQDDQIGRPLQIFMESVVPTFDYFIEKISDYDDLRDPLLAPVERSFLREITLLQVDNLGDGTSRVFVSKGSADDKLVGVRVGQNLTDSTGSKFQIIRVNNSERAVDYSVTPIDPVGSNPTGKNIVVRNLYSGNIEVIPRVSGAVASSILTPTGTETVTLTPTNNGTSLGPYSFTVALAPIALTMVKVEWTESVAKAGYFLSDGSFFGDITVGSSINFTTGVIVINPSSRIAISASAVTCTYVTRWTLAENHNLDVVPTPDGVATGPYVLTVSHAPIDNSKSVYVRWTDSILGIVVGSFNPAGVPDGTYLNATSTINFTTGVVSIKTTGGSVITGATTGPQLNYLSTLVVPPEDSTITTQNLLALLASDYGIALDRHDPEAYQRSYVYNAYGLWDQKGTAGGYQAMGALAGYLVKPKRLWRLSTSLRLALPVENVFEFAGNLITSEIPGEATGTSISPLMDGVALGPFTIQLSSFPLWRVSGSPQMSWTQGSVPYSFYFDNSGAAIMTAEVDAVVDSASRDIVNGTITITFAASHPPDPGSVSVTYTPGVYYTDLEPRQPLFDDIVADALPADLFCFDSSFPNMTQPVTLDSAVFSSTEGSLTRYLFTVSTSRSYASFGTEGIFTDFASVEYPVEEFAWTSATTYTFKSTSGTPPTPGSGTVQWFVLQNLLSTVTDNPGTTTGSTISPAENGVALGAFTIQLANYPITSALLTIDWTESSVAKTATLAGISTLGGTHSGHISSASINRTTGAMSITFNGGFPPDADSIRIAYGPVSDIDIVGIGTDVTVMGAQYFGYTGIRYKLRVTLIDEIVLSFVGNWKVIDSDGVQSWIEKVELISSSPYVYDIEFISDSVPASGPANIFYSL